MSTIIKETIEIRKKSGHAADAAVGSSGKSYERPMLVHYGDVRDITLGVTGGIGESGNEFGFRNE